jgi:DMSO reductase anchor subunit
MIYVDTQREFWRTSQCFGKFFGTTLLLGAATVLAITNAANWPAVAVLLGATVVKLGFENRIFQQLVDVDTITLTSLNKTARLMTDELGLVERLRVACGIMGGVVLPLYLLVNHAGPGLALSALVLCVVGELLERYLFFTAVAPAKMPGGFVA